MTWENALICLLRRYPHGEVEIDPLELNLSLDFGYQIIEHDNGRKLIVKTFKLKPKLAKYKKSKFSI